jgi:catechol 2,3-dioxygenase-like lactoylglutathione lyase family enzyme
MSLPRLDNIGIVVQDLHAAVAFFQEIGLTVEGEAEVEGPWVDKTVGLKDVSSKIVMMRTPDGHGRLELSKYHKPKAHHPEPKDPPANTLGLHRVMFAVQGIDHLLERLRAQGAEVLGEVAQFGDQYRLCYVRGPEGILVALAEQLR